MATANTLPIVPSWLATFLGRAGALACVLTVLAVLGASPLRAEEAEPLEEPYATWEHTAEVAQDILEKHEATTEALELLRARLATERKAAFEIVQSGSVKVRTLEAQLNALGPPPAEGETEGEQVASEREDLNKALAAANRPILASREAYERADLLIAEVDSLIRQQTTSKLLTRSPTPLMPTRWLPAFGELVVYGERVSGELLESLRHPAERAKLRVAAPSIALLTAIGILLLCLAQPVAARRLLRAAQNTRGSWRRLSYLVLRNLSHLIIPGLGAAAILLAIRLADVTPSSAQSLAEVAAMITGVIVIAHWLGYSLFMPVDTDQRLLNIEGQTGKRAFRLCQALGLLLAVELCFDAIHSDVSFTPESSAVLGGLIILVGSLLLWALASLVRRARSIEASASEALDHGGIRQTDFPRLLARLMQLSALLALIFAASGFVELARQALIPMIISIGLIGSTYFLYRVIMAAIGIITGHDYANQDDDRSLLSIAIIALLSLALVPVLALAWGARIEEIAEVWRLLVDGVEFGETRISLEAVIKLIVIFGVGLLLTRWLQKFLRTTVLPRTQIDVGGKTALVTGVGYVGLTIAALVAVSAAGLNLSNLAVVAGALSVGIGFGLQTMVSNFVSGIILLIERPIKEGDWIEVSGYSGIVRKIAVRSTRIETFDQHDVIVPNSELIAGIVKNMTLSSKSGRIMIPVGIGYGSDLEAARQIMRTAAENHRMVMKHPEPQVVFMGLGDSSLDFELRCYLHDVGASISARSEMLFEIYSELGKAGIEIPFPQRDLHLRDIDRLVRAIEGRAAASRERGQIDKVADAEAQLAGPGQ